MQSAHCSTGHKTWHTSSSIQETGVLLAPADPKLADQSPEPIVSVSARQLPFQSCSYRPPTSCIHEQGPALTPEDGAQVIGKPSAFAACDADSELAGSPFHRQGSLPVSLDQNEDDCVTVKAHSYGLLLMSILDHQQCFLHLLMSFLSGRKRGHRLNLTCSGG